MFCKNCGTEVGDGNNLCKNCRTPSPDKKKSKRSFLHLIFGGRISRLRYFLYLIIFSLLMSLLLALPLSYIRVSYGNEIYIKSFSIIIYIALLFSIPIAVKRLHDIGWPGFLSLIFYVIGLIPGAYFISIIFGLILLFKKGEAGKNKYGFP